MNFGQVALTGLSVVLSLVAAYYGYLIYLAYSTVSSGFGLLFVASIMLAIQRILSLWLEIGSFPWGADAFSFASDLLFVALGIVICVSAYHVKKMTEGYKLMKWKAMKEAMENIREFERHALKNLGSQDQGKKRK